jgi:phage-related minor tail protein
MESLPAKVDEDLRDAVEEWAEEHTGGNTSKAVRRLLRRGLDYERLERGHEHVRARIQAEHEKEVTHLEARADDLRRQLAQANKRNDEVTELVEYVEDERSTEQRRRQAGVLTRTKWWLTGMPDDEETN